ncbi:MAG: hypothetical protein HY916_10530 [Desulfovibrio sp.]|jgi:hypothetical protein|nr:hypothetical protein [Desulfovibrio sp.]
MALDENTLIAAVVQAVLERLGHRPLPVAMVLAPADAQLAREVDRRLGGRMRVCFQGEPREGQEEPALYVAPVLSCADTADLALGRASSAELRAVLDLLLRGAPVCTLGFAHRAHAQTAPHALLRLYEGHVAALASYGLTELSPCAPESMPVRDMLVTAEHVAAAAAKGVRALRAPRAALVTPLAEEAAAEHGLVILKNL